MHNANHLPMMMWGGELECSHRLGEQWMQLHNWNYHISLHVLYKRQRNALKLMAEGLVCVPVFLIYRFQIDKSRAADPDALTP